MANERILLQIPNKRIESNCFLSNWYIRSVVWIWSCGADSIKASLRLEARESFLTWLIIAKLWGQVVSRKHSLVKKRNFRTTLTPVSNFIKLLLFRSDFDGNKQVFFDCFATCKYCIIWRTNRTQTGTCPPIHIQTIEIFKCLFWYFAHSIRKDNSNYAQPSSPFPNIKHFKTLASSTLSKHLWS